MNRALRPTISFEASDVMGPPSFHFSRKLNPPRQSLRSYFYDSHGKSLIILQLVSLPAYERRPALEVRQVRLPPGRL